MILLLLFVVILISILLYRRQKRKQVKDDYDFGPAPDDMKDHTGIHPSQRRKF